MKRIYFLTLCVLTMLTACDNRNCPKWQIAGDKIRTPWAEQVMPDEVLPEYPRPQLRRTEWQNLNGLWQYALTEKGLPEPAVWDGNILVPFAKLCTISGAPQSINLFFTQLCPTPPGFVEDLTDFGKSLAPRSREIKYM